jgi:ribosome-binding protein aMBF1 (putative translation factor)
MPQSSPRKSRNTRASTSSITAPVAAEHPARKHNTNANTNSTPPKRNRLTTTTDRAQLLAAFGRKLRKARQQKGLSPLQFYYKSGIDASNLAKYESGQREPGLVIIMIMAKTLEVHPHQLLDINFTGTT